MKRSTKGRLIALAGAIGLSLGSACLVRNARERHTNNDLYWAEKQRTCLLDFVGGTDALYRSVHQNIYDAALRNEAVSSRTLGEISGLFDVSDEGAFEFANAYKNFYGFLNAFYSHDADLKKIFDERLSNVLNEKVNAIGKVQHNIKKNPHFLRPINLLYRDAFTFMIYGHKGRTLGKSVAYEGYTFDQPAYAFITDSGNFNEYFKRLFDFSDSAYALHGFARSADINKDTKITVEEASNTFLDAFRRGFVGSK